jgi:hypothetical protein
MVQKQAVAASTTVPLGQPTLTLGENGSYRIEGQLDAATLQPKAATPEPDVADGATPVEPDVTDAKVQIITIDTDEGGKGDSSSDSTGASSADSDPDGEDVYDSGSDAVIASASDALQSGNAEVLVTHLQSVMEMFQRTAAELVVERGLRVEAETAKAAAERTRDEAVAQAGQIVLAASEVIEKIANTPLGRKATVKEAAAELSHLESTYSAEAMKMLRNLNA